MYEEELLRIYKKNFNCKNTDTVVQNNKLIIQFILSCRYLCLFILKYQILRIKLMKTYLSYFMKLIYWRCCKLEQYSCYCLFSYQHKIQKYLTNLEPNIVWLDVNIICYWRLKIKLKLLEIIHFEYKIKMAFCNIILNQVNIRVLHNMYVSIW